MSEHDSTTGKVCKDCKQHKPFSEFSNKKRSKDGLNYICRPCASSYFKAYSEKHKDALREKQSERYYARTPEQKKRMRQLNTDYRARNADKINSRRREKGLTQEQENQYKSRSRSWYLANKERVLEKATIYYRENREQVRANIRRYVRANPEKVRMLGRVKAHRRRIRLEAAGGTNYTRQDIEKLYELQRGCCASCRKKLNKKYHIDHRIPVAKGGNNSIGNIDLLCPPCNLKKSDKLPHVFAQENGRLI